MDPNDINKNQVPPVAASDGSSGLPPLSTAEDDTFAPPPPPPTASTTPPEKSGAFGTATGASTPGGLPPIDTLPAEEISADTSHLGNESAKTPGFSGADSKQTRMTKRNKFNKKTIIGGVVALVLLVGVPLVALNIGRFRGDIRQRASGGNSCAGPLSAAACKSKTVGATCLTENSSNVPAAVCKRTTDDNCGCVPFVTTTPTPTRGRAGGTPRPTPTSGGSGACPQGTSNRGSITACATGCSNDCVSDSAGSPQCCPLNGTGGGGEACQYDATSGYWCSSGSPSSQNSSCTCSDGTGGGGGGRSGIGGGESCDVSSFGKCGGQGSNCPTGSKCKRYLLPRRYICKVDPSCTTPTPTGSGGRGPTCREGCIAAGNTAGECAGLPSCERGTCPAGTSNRGSITACATGCSNDCVDDSAGVPECCPLPTPTRGGGTPTPTRGGGGSSSSSSSGGGGSSSSSSSGGGGGMCVETRVYTMQNGSWEITTMSEIGQYAGIGDVIRLAVRGDSSNFSQGRFRINGGAWQTTTSKNAAGEFYIEYTLSQVGTYNVEGEVE